MSWVSLVPGLLGCEPPRAPWCRLWGGDVLIDEITVRTLECDWINVDFHRVSLNTENFNEMNLMSVAS